MASRTDGDWPIDPDGEGASDGMRRFDMAVLSGYEPKSAFPMTADEFRDRHGDKPVRINHETVVAVSEILEQLAVDRFETKTEFHAAVGDAIRDAGLWAYHPGS